MIDGLTLTFSGEELRTLLDARVNDHRARADRWSHETTRTRADETDEAPLLPEHMCTNEAERHRWRADVLQFLRDHLEAAETYRLCAADLEFGELLPSRPNWLEQDEHEERNRVAFTLERMTRAVDRLAASTEESLWKRDSQETEDAAATEKDEFTTTRLDLGGEGPEVIMIERKDRT